MVIVLMLCVSMAALSAVFWVIEIAPLWQYIKCMPDIRWNTSSVAIIINPLLFCNRIIQIIKAIPLGIYFIVDISATVALAGMFSLGGIMGTMIGLTVSNVISIALLMDMKNK